MKFKGNMILLAAILFPILILGGCTKVEEPDYREKTYGYVQFKLYKEASYGDTKAVVDMLDFLRDVTKIKVTLRYGQNETPATVEQIGEGRIRVGFDVPQRAIAKGQSVVLYDGDIVVGGGIIKSIL